METKAFFLSVVGARAHGDMVQAEINRQFIPSATVGLSPVERQDCRRILVDSRRGAIFPGDFRAKPDHASVAGYQGLYVMGGALTPGSTGAVNPLLRICALAEGNIANIIANGS